MSFAQMFQSWMGPVASLTTKVVLGRMGANVTFALNANRRPRARLFVTRCLMVAASSTMSEETAAGKSPRTNRKMRKMVVRLAMSVL